MYSNTWDPHQHERQSVSRRCPAVTGWEAERQPVHHRKTAHSLSLSHSFLSLSTSPSFPCLRSGLLITAVFDRNINCRRAASVSSSNSYHHFTELLNDWHWFMLFILSQAAFQENVGRQVSNHKMESGFVMRKSLWFGLFAAKYPGLAQTCLISSRMTTGHSDLVATSS